MKKEDCPIADYNSDFCCNIALYEKESYENCNDCAKQHKKDLQRFIKWLKSSK